MPWTSRVPATPSTVLRSTSRLAGLARQREQAVHLVRLAGLELIGLARARDRREVKGAAVAGERGAGAAAAVQELDAARAGLESLRPASSRCGRWSTHELQSGLLARSLILSDVGADPSSHVARPG